MRYATFEVINMFAGMRDAVAKLLQLEEPWFVESIYFDEKLAEVHIHVGIRDGARFVCPRCGSEASRDGYEPTERVWRHSDCFFYKTTSIVVVHVFCAHIVERSKSMHLLKGSIAGLPSPMRGTRCFF